MCRAGKGWLLATKKNNEGHKGKRENLATPNPETRHVWESIVKNYGMINGAQLSNSFIILMAFSESKEPLNTTQVSQMIAQSHLILILSSAINSSNNKSII